MYYVTGDTHGEPVIWRGPLDRFLKPGDSLIVLGDFGIGFYGRHKKSEEEFFDELSEKPYTILFCDGNHENFDKLNKYEISEWNGGKVHQIRKNIIHLMRGEIYDIDGKKVFVFGGGCSIDRMYRVPGKSWWPEEMPSEEEQANAVSNLKKHGNQVDYILTHTAPDETVELISIMRLGIDRTFKDELPLTTFLNWIEDTVKYEKWYFGHFHIDKELWKNQYAVLDGIRELDTGTLAKMRYER